MVHLSKIHCWIWVVLSFCCCFLVLSESVVDHSDKNVLWSFKSLISSDPSRILDSWNENSHYCNWTGVSCGRFGDGVVGLRLPRLELEGSLSPLLSNLSLIRFLSLEENKFSGSLPTLIASASRLKFLNLSFNRIEGIIPSNISQCSELEILDLTENKISGQIPQEIDRVSKLKILRLGQNLLNSQIPPTVGNITSLRILEIKSNKLSGTVPNELGKLNNLKSLDLTSNSLSGQIPPSLYNLSSLVIFSLADNRLTGEIPSDVGFRLPNLLVFHLCINSLTGLVPKSLHNMTKIQSLRLSYNLLSGMIPNGVENLQDVRRYQIGHNKIRSYGNSGLDFITAFTNCSKLEYLYLEENLLEGLIPDSIGNLSLTLKALNVGSNKIYGTIPSSIGSLGNLALLNLSHNQIWGEIPSTMGDLRGMQKLDLAKNKISGSIPSSMGKLTKLMELSLYENLLEGCIPSSFGKLTKLLRLDLSNNRLNGSIPQQIFTLSSLGIYLNLSKNSLTGSLPEVLQLERVVAVDISDNHLSGRIPNSFGSFKSLEYLSLARNTFSGPIPSSLSVLKGLICLDLSSNKLSGVIPSDFQNLVDLQLLNFSFNNLEGQVPKGGIFINMSRVHLEGNAKLCIFTPCRTSSKSRSLILIIVILTVFSFAALVLGFSFWFIFCHRANSKVNLENQSPESYSWEHPMVSYEELYKATNHFSQENLIGSGSFGTVYCGKLKETKVAIKVINLSTRDASESFITECEILKKVRHRNLIKLITSCSSVDLQNQPFLALVYELMSNGSLEDWIKVNQRNYELNLKERLNVAIDIASAMDYLHNDCKDRVVHCDLKPSNVFLDEDMTVKIGDFGLARLMVERCSGWNQPSAHHLTGSIGYIPPEYGLGGYPSTEGDVYSYGVMLLELYTGRSPTHESFIGESSLVNWARSSFPDMIINILDPKLLRQLTAGNDNCQGHSMILQKQQESIYLIIKIALSCTVTSPKSRLKIRDALNELHNIREYLLKVDRDGDI